MELLRELLQINRDIELTELFEDLGNLGQLELGPMVNAFKQTYNAYSNGRRGDVKNSSTEGNKFQDMRVGKDSETVEGGNIKNWPGLKRVYKKFSDDKPVATIFTVDKKPVALLIASEWDTNSVNDKVALAWDFSKTEISDEEAEVLTRNLNKAGQKEWRGEVIGTTRSPKTSVRKDEIKSKDYDYKVHDYVEKFTTRKYAGFVQTVREVAPFVNDLAAAFKTRLEVKLILADKVRDAKRSERLKNQPIDPEKLQLFQDDIKTRLAKYKNTKVDTAEDAQDFIDKVLGGGLKKVKFEGRTYSAVPTKKYLGSNSRGRGENHRAFYDGTIADLFAGKQVTLDFEADRNEKDYNTLYLTIKLVKGAIVPVKMRFSSRDQNSSKEIKFD